MRFRRWSVQYRAVRLIFAQVPLADGNLGLQAKGVAANIGMELKGKGSGPLLWDGVQIADRSGALPGVVYSVSASPTLAEVNAGYTFLAGASGRAITVVHALVQALGGAVGTCTDVRISDTTGSPVDVTITPRANLTEGTVTDETIVGVTLGTFGTALASGKGLQVLKTGTACDTATSFFVLVDYKVN